MLERERLEVSRWPSLEELVQRTADGWKIVAIDWEREPNADRVPAGPQGIEIPYGFRATADGFHMVDEPRERRALMVILDSIVEDRPLSQAAADLNRVGLLNRQGRPWTPAQVFDLLPRLIEAGPTIFSSPDWIAERKKRAVKIGG
jgi:hypothetical protein